LSYAFQVSDETYRAIEALASGQGQTPEALAEAWLKERVEAESEIARQNAVWDAS
jgi:predicted transcriptional regulator